MNAEATITCWRGARGRPGLRQFVVRHDEGLAELFDFAAELCELYDSIELALYDADAIAAFVWDWRRHLWEPTR